MTNSTTHQCKRNGVAVWLTYPAGKWLRKDTRNYVLHSVTEVIMIPRKIVPPRKGRARYREISTLIYETNIGETITVVKTH